MPESDLNPSTDFLDRPFVNVLGLPISAVNPPELLGWIDDRIRLGEKGSISFTGVHGVMEAQDGGEKAAGIRGVSLRVPDGMPLVWIGRLFRGQTAMRRCYGPDVMLDTMAVSVERRYTHFFYGGQEGVADLLKDEMCRRFPGLDVVGTYTPPFRELTADEEADLVRRVEAVRPDIIWVGISTPKQEMFMHRYLSRLDCRVMLGVGAAFDFHTGRISQAPSWMQTLCLEWLFRTACEPRRLAPRYFRNNTRFLWRFMLQVLGLRRYELPPPVSHDVVS